MKNLFRLTILLLTLILSVKCKDKRSLEPLEGPLLKVGDLYYGGIIAYVEPNGLHGIVVPGVDVAYSSAWSSINSITNATNNAIYGGAINTSIIVSALGNGNSAASLCDAFTYEGYNDWYLPSKDELDLVRQQNDKEIFFVKGFYYWSSTEVSNSQAWCQKMTGDSVVQIISNKTQAYHIVAIRRF